MGKEIERKFLVQRELWRPSAVVHDVRQGYLSREPGRTVRVRRKDARGYLTIKGPTVGASRAEYEYEIPAADADALLAMCPSPLIEKRRHVLVHEGKTWEVDEFWGDNAGLLLAEIELDREDERFALPPWAGQEVTTDARYFNASLAVHPFTRW